jgi:hypothetical protein
MATVLRAIARTNPSTRIGLILLVSWAVATGMGKPHGATRPAGLVDFPRLTVWAWEHPEDLRSLDPKRYAVAYLDQTIFIAPQVSSRPRLQRLLVSPAMQIIAVVRIEAGAAGAAIDDPKLPVQIAGMIVRSAQKPRTDVLQIDFDATRSQRAFYINLLREVRKKLPEGMPLSITALASWCAGDDWISGLPVDEAVPMFFRMGIEARPSSLPGWTYPLCEPLCESSAGVSTDEPWPALRGDERVYIFHPGAWTPAAMANVEAMVKP